MIATSAPKKPLASKEASNFRQILKLYENKQYKKALKLAEQILKKVPDHGETMAMKGLLISHVGRKEEAYELIKQGLRLDLNSHICWHVFGLLYRGDKNYDESIKCYRQALKRDKENLQIIRDLALMQLQKRDYEGYNESRHLMLKLRPANKMNWIGLAVSYHLLEKYETAVKVIDTYEASLKEKPVEFEQSELQLYKVMMLKEQGAFEKALKLLQDSQSIIVDDLAYMEERADLFFLLNRKELAIKQLEELIEYNPHNMNYYKKIEECQELSLQQKVDYFIKTSKTTLKNFECQRHVLMICDDMSIFEEQVRSMIEAGKHIPSLFMNFKPLYSIEVKKVALEKIFEDLNSNSEPSLWLYFLLTRHYDALGDFSKASTYIEKCLMIDPNAVDALMFQARIYKHQGKLTLAAETMNKARLLDLSDRFVNTKATKYYLRAHNLESAQKTISLFTKQGELDDQLKDLVEMQCMWFALECGSSYMARNMPGSALKFYEQIFQFFEDIWEDQFDFHTYCLRKLCLRAYVQLIRLEDRLRDQNYFVAAAINAIHVYLSLVDAAGEKEELDKQMDQLSVSEQKKMKNKMKRQEARDSKKIEQGKEFLDKDPIVQAKRFFTPLMSLCQNDVRTYLSGFDIYIREKKYLVTLKMVKGALGLEPNNFKSVVNAVRFFVQWEKVKDTEMNSVVKQKVSDEMKFLFPEGIDPVLQKIGEFKVANYLALFYRGQVTKVHLKELITQLEPLTYKIWCSVRNYLAFSVALGLEFVNQLENVWFPQ